MSDAKPRNILEERVECAMKRKGWNQNDLARALKISPQGVSKAIRQGRNLRPGTLKKWADKLDVSPDFLRGIEPVGFVSNEQKEALLVHARSIGINPKELKAIGLILSADEQKLGLVVDFLESDFPGLDDLIARIRAALDNAENSSTG